MSDRLNVKVFIPAASRGGYVEIDGERQKNVRAISIHAEVDQAASVTLELVNVEVDVVAEDAHITRIRDTTTLDSETRSYQLVP